MAIDIEGLITYEEFDNEKGKFVKKFPQQKVEIMKNKLELESIMIEGILPISQIFARIGEKLYPVTDVEKAVGGGNLIFTVNYKPGRPFKYASDNERRAAKRESWKKANARRKKVK
jgi:hypothetical protein